MADSPLITVTGAPAVTEVYTTLTINANKTSVIVGGVVTISGALKTTSYAPGFPVGTGVPDARIDLDVVHTDGTVDVWHLYTDYKGEYSTVIVISEVGTWKFQAHFAGLAQPVYNIFFLGCEETVNVSGYEVAPPVLPAELSLPLIAAAAIAIVDIALIGYYLVTNPPKT